MLYAHYHYRIFADDLSSRAALEILQSRRWVAGLSDTPQTFTNTTALWKLAGSTSQLGCSPQSHVCSGNVFCFSEAKPPKSFDTAISSSFTATTTRATKTTTQAMSHSNNNCNNNQDKTTSNVPYLRDTWSLQISNNRQCFPLSMPLSQLHHKQPFISITMLSFVGYHKC